MTEKVKVSREVAEAIESLKEGFTLTEIFNMVTADFKVALEHVQLLCNWNGENGDEGKSLMKLLVGNYEVEQTPEEQLVEEYQYWLKALNNYEGKELGRVDYGREKFASGFVSAVKKLSQIHKIKGVNA